MVHPKLTDAFVAQPDASMRQALSQLQSVDPSSMLRCHQSAIYQGWHGVAQRRCDFSGAYWSSWADCLEMIAARNPGVADLIVTEIGQAEAGFHVLAHHKLGNS